jgi:hypothetical protein
MAITMITCTLRDTELVDRRCICVFNPDRLLTTVSNKIGDAREWSFADKLTDTSA